MADDELLRQQKEEQLNKVIRVGSTHEASELKRKDRELYNTQAVERDNTVINNILHSGTLELQDAERARLSAIKGRNLSTLLLLQEKTFGDSPKMKAVKEAVAAIEVALSTNKQGNEAYSPMNVEDVLTMYSKAILACREYMVLKSPSYKNGKHRYDQVRLNMIRLHEEAEAFMNAKALLETGVLDGQVPTLHELLVQSKVYSLGHGTGVPEGQVPRRDAFDERKLETLGMEAGFLYSALSGKVTPSDLIMKLSKSRDKNKKALAAELPLFFFNLRSLVGGFAEGKVEAKYFLLGKSLFCVSQNVYGQLTLSIGRNYIPLERGTGLLTDMLSTDIVKNRKIYGKYAADSVIREVIGGADAFELNTGKRQILTDYLVNKTGRPSSTFTNFYTNSLILMIQALLGGRNVYIVKLGKEIKKPLTANDVVFTEDESRMINIAEMRELMTDAGKQERREKIKSQVVLKKKEEKKEEKGPAPKKQEKEQKKEGEWDKRESKIKNLLGDIMFSYETWDADNKVLLPGVRLKTMILKNHEAVAELVADLYRRNGDQRAVINGIVDQLPLFALQDDEKVMKFRTELTETLNKVTDKINEKISEHAFFAFGEALKNLEVMEQEELRKRIQREYEAAKRERENKKSLEKGNSFTNFFRKIGQYSVKAAVAVKNKAEDLKDEGVKNVKFIKTNAILKHLTDPAALIAGNKTFGIPGIMEIIENTEMDTFINLEQSIDESVEAAAEGIQSTVSQFADELFHPAEQVVEELPNPYEEGIDEEEVKKRKRDRIRIGNERLIKMTKDSISSGESGQGLFIKNVFESYFTGVSTIDKRSMIASMIRSARPVGKLLDENDPALRTDIDGLSEEGMARRAEEKRRRKEYNDKLKTQAMAGYLGGLLKGAGPLFQKMMQGLPLDGLPDELKGAVEDMKSKLAPIPDEIVEAQLNSIVESSHKQIKKIEVLKSLGAASVGQTFLCKLIRSDGIEEECAVKLLKPDVRNRMMREKKLMTECARKTDKIGRQKDNLKRAEAGLPQLPDFKKNEKGGMQATYEGQLMRIEEELDLTIEARNVELGKIYDKARNEKEEKVVSMKLNDLVAPATNYMVLKKAPGETLDSLLKRVGDETRRLRNLYKRATYLNADIPEEKKTHLRQMAVAYPDFSSIKTICDEVGIEKYTKQYEELDPIYIQEKLCGLLSELKKKKAYLEAYAFKWTKEGVFEDGFYHGDPHDGNIMISDEKLTVIDFGNCTKITEDQQVHITKMMVAASIGDMKTFRHGFHKLLRPELENLYQEKRGELSRKFAEIFALGNRRSSGARIAVALLEAQKLGLEIPAAVFNFSQGQMRLQNAIDNMNRQIRETEEAAEFFTDLDGEGNPFDFTDQTRIHDVNINPSTKTASKAYTGDLMRYTDSKEDLKSLAFDDPITMEEAFFGRFGRTAGAKFDDAIAGLREVARSVKGIPYDPNNQQQNNTMAGGLELGINERVIKGIKSMCDPELVMEILQSISSGYRNQNLDDHQVDVLAERLNEQKAIAEGIYRAYEAMEKKRVKILEKHSNKWVPTEQEKAEYNELRDRFVDAYFPIHMKFSLFRVLASEGFGKLTNPDNVERERMGLNMSRFFSKHPEGREEFMLVYNDFIGAQDAGLNLTDPPVYNEKKKALASAYQKVMAGRLREKQKTFRFAVKKQDGDFLEIMSDVVDEEFSKMLSRLGIIDSLIVDHRFEQQKKEEEALKEGNDNDN